MAKGLFFNMPLHGHVNPTLPVVRELTRRGDELVYFLPESFRGAVERTGARLFPYESSLEGISVGPGANHPPLPVMMIGESRKQLPSLLEAVRAEAPDYVVYDSLCHWGRIITRKLKLRGAISHPSYASNAQWSMAKAFLKLPGAPSPEVFARMNAGLAELGREYGLPAFDMHSLMTDVEPLNLVFLPRAFQPEGDSFDERFLFVGPSLESEARGGAGDFPLERLEGGRTLYISLGTVFNDWPDFYRTCFTAFGDSPWQVVLSAGKAASQETLGAAPGNFVVRASVPQLEVLARTSVFVTHGGMNSTMEALHDGVPLVVIPQMAEQAVTAARVAELGLGLALDRASVTATSLREAVERVAHEPSFRERAQRMQQEVRGAGGYRRAADALQALVRRPA
jgi:MGT family glycosyltransferase